MRRPRIFSRLLGDTAGGTAIIFAMALPVLAVLVAGSIDLASVRADRSRAQDVADAAALAAARQLTVSDTQGVAARAKAFADYQLSGLSDRLTYSVTTTSIDSGHGVTVSIDGRRASFFGNLLPPGGWKIDVQATAGTMARAPLCVLTSGAVKDDTLSMQDQAQITAGECMLHANADISVANAAVMRAARVQTAGTATGTILPTAQTSAPAIMDPFTSVDLLPSATQWYTSLTTQLVSTPTTTLTIAPTTKVSGAGKVMATSTVSATNTLTNAVTQVTSKISTVTLDNGTVVQCAPTDQLFSVGIYVLAPGVHCGNLTAAAGSTIYLVPGEHYFVGSHLQLADNSIIQGSDVVLVFDKDSKFTFKDSSQVKLEGRKTGKLAGFVLATTRENRETFQISSSNARLLLGTIYIPNAILEISGASNSIGDQSAWTVIVARAIHMVGSPNLVINSNYAASSVPVPAGVGPVNGVDAVLRN